MTGYAHAILLIGTDPVTAATIRAALAAPAENPHVIIWVRDLASGLVRLGEGGIDAVLLDLVLPDSQGIETFDQVFVAARRVPIVVLTGLDGEDTAREAVRRGAKDRVLTEHVDRSSFPLVLRHVLERTALDNALFVERERAQVTLNSIGDGVISTDTEGKVTYLNPVAERMTGWSREAAVGRKFSEVFRSIDGDTRQPAPDPMQSAVQGNDTVRLAVNSLLIRRDGLESAIEDSIAPIHAQDGQIIGAVMVFRDVTEARVLELKLSRFAQHDSLTGLPNRMLLHDRLNQAIAFARRHRKHVAVLFLDLDRFKHINDSLGHAIGDKVLQAVGKRLVAAVRGSDTVSRQGGDEFVVVLSEVEHATNAARHAEKIHAALSPAHAIAQHDLQVDVSIGISIFPDDGQDAETLIKGADIAMYHAKENGRNTYQFFKPEMNARAAERQSLEAHLFHALERREFVLHYQVRKNLETGAISGAEALIRWAHPERGLLPPAHLVPIAEDCGLIVPIGRWVLREACLQAQAWQAAGLPPVPVAVNISGLEFRHKDFLAGIRAILAETRLEPRYLELEVTESILMHDVESTAPVLQALKSIGVSLVVDDFGTGYSSLNYLREFPIDAVKIDQTFVHKSTIDPNDAAIVSAMISLGRSLRQRVIAEGVETREQLAFLRTRFCDEGQGYYIGRPVAAEEFAELLGTPLRQPFASERVSAVGAR
ncbi:MAG: EAL domain-containing protein [Pseudomonadota bacterium]|nr:EAL domain-containing protein [Pseudomonadota bacterium]